LTGHILHEGRIVSQPVDVTVKRQVLLFQPLHLVT
jgi:hypothetical protein